MKIWNLKKQSLYYRNTKKYLEVSCVSWNNNNTLLAFGTSTGDIEVIDFKQKTAVATYAKKNYDGIKALKFSPFSKDLICSGCKDGSVGLYNIQQPDLISRYWKMHNNKVMGIDFTNLNEDLVISCSLDEKLAFLDIRQKKIANQMDLETPLTCLSVNPNGYSIVVGTYSGEIRSVDIRKGETGAMKYKGHKSLVKSIDYSKVLKSHKKHDSMSITSNLRSTKRDGNSRLSDNKDSLSLQDQSINKTLKDIRADTPLKKPLPQIADPRLMATSITAESRYLVDPNRPQLPMKQPEIDQKIENALKPKLNGITNGLSLDDKDEIKNFIRSEINTLRLDMIREFELQRQEFRKMIEETKNQQK